MMSEKTSITKETARSLYPIRTVSKLTGVNSITLRAWETRYGLIKPIRKESGHRLYTQEHIDLINRVVGLLDRGMRIGQVKAALESGQEAEPRSSEGDAISGDWLRYVKGMLAAIIRFDELALDEVYNEALSHYPIAQVSDKLITPLMVELGRRWETETGTVAEEHFFAVYLRNKLGARFHHRARNNEGPKLLMACLPGELHETGLLMFALVCHGAGYQPIILGADTPLEDIAVAAAKTACDAIVLSGLMVPEPKVLNKQLPQLTRSVEIPVIIGGHVTAKIFDSLKRLNIESLGADAGVGLKRLEEIVPL